MLQIFTKTTTSLVARAKISAHETLFLQLGTLSTAALALITVSNPSPASERLSELSFSDPRFLEASMTEASQPWHINKNPPTTFKRMKKKKPNKKNTENALPGRNSRGKRAGEWPEPSRMSGGTSC
jgi:hypothetical protein